jgi:CO/xanthine dehydrogenase FAD-binding subunit
VAQPRLPDRGPESVPVEPPVVSPASLAEAYALAAAAVHRPLAGGTDLLVQISGEIGEPPERVLDLWRLDELRGIAVRDGALELGALTTYTEIRRSSVCAEHAPALVEAAATIGAAQIQNRGTIGGNAMNASPAGDTLPALLALDAAMVAGSRSGERTIPAGAFWPAYRRTAVRPDELLVRIRIPIVRGREQRFRKVGTRRAQAISKVVIALAWREEHGSGAWRDVRVALGSVAPTPVRAGPTEAVLEGAVSGPQATDRAVAALTAELEPIDDVRSTAAYRREVAGRVLRRLLRDAGDW